MKIKIIKDGENIRKNIIDVLEPYNGEILFSWLSRMYSWYGYKGMSTQNIKLFNNIVLGENAKVVSSVLIPECIESMVENINLPDSNYFRSADQVIKSMTAVHFYIQFIEENKKQRVLKNIYGHTATHESKRFLGLSKLSIQENAKTHLKFCKLCWKESGRKYFRSEHLVPENKVCYIHKVSLCYIEHEPYKYYSFNNEDNKKDMNVCIKESDKQFSIYIKLAQIIHQIFEQGLQDDILKLKSKIRKRLSDIGYYNESMTFMNEYSKFTEDFAEYNILKIKIEDLANAMFFNRYTPNPMIYLVLIMLLFDNLECYYKYSISDNNIQYKSYDVSCREHAFLKASKICNLDYYNSIVKSRQDNDNDYSIIKWKKGGYYIVKHNECSHEWPVHTTKLSEYTILCPKCRAKNKQEQYRKDREQLIKKISEEYEYVDIAGNNWLIKHMRCGKTFPYAPNRFVSGTRCRTCKRFEEHSEKLSRITRQEYRLIKFERIDKKCVILHDIIGCKEEFEILLHGFYKKLTCPKCDKYIVLYETEI